MVAGDFPETVMKTVDKYVPKSECKLYNNKDQFWETISSEKKSSSLGDDSTVMFEWHFIKSIKCNCIEKNREIEKILTKTVNIYIHQIHLE